MFAARRRGSQSRPESRNSRGVLEKCGTIETLQFRLLASNHNRIKHGKVRGQQGGRNPGVAGHRKTGSKQETPQIQRISSERVRPRGRELFVFAKVPRGIAAHEQAPERDASAAQEPHPFWLRKIKCCNSNEISGAHAPFDPKIYGDAQSECL